ncbi:soluble inorganic pyrophosphatase 6, chloroplastic-like [Primulina eburnea]|uniref:soluble inorganic pyrophosphatase 6, chloroplastic-like n=1 Tax=Primulina eburnea TaxID=1245227 RepID=UPI003C6C73B1
MAAARVIASASGTLNASLLLSRVPLKGNPRSLRLCFSNNRLPTLKRRLFTCSAIFNPQFQTKEEGQQETFDYRVFFVDNSGKKISPWHDIPLHLGDGVFNYIVEIPKESSTKMEVATDEVFTPIKQDTKKGKLRYYLHNINWNFGLLPQTCEDPAFANAEVEGAFGSNDPVDVVDIGQSQAKIGQVLKVKPLAALAMIDEGEID